MKNGCPDRASQPFLGAIGGLVFELDVDAAEYVSAPYPPEPRAPEVEVRRLDNTDRLQPREPTLRMGNHRTAPRGGAWTSGRSSGLEPC